MRLYALVFVGSAVMVGVALVHLATALMGW